jgi:iron complex outermembrane receptor protein
MKKIFILSIVIHLSTLLSAQNSITGIITDDDHHPLQGATVFIPEMNKGTTSGHDGQYTLRGLPSGMARVQISYIGYTTRIETPTLSGGEIRLDITLSATPIETEEIVISGGYNATQHENALKIDLIKPGVQSTGNTPDFTRVLTSLPGVNMISKGPGISKPVIRGLSMNDILVLNNNVRFENYQYSDHHPLGINEFGLEDIEVIKGPASLIYGSDAIGGVINFLREKPAPVGTIAGDYNLQAFSNTLGMVQNLGIRGTSEHFFGGLRAGYKTHADYLQGGGKFLPNSRFTEWAVKGMAGYTARTGTFRIYYDYTDQTLGLAEEEAIEEVISRGRETEVWYQHFISQVLSSQNKLFLGNSRLELNASWQSTALAHITEKDLTKIEMELSTITYEGRLTQPFAYGFETIFGFQGMNQVNRNINDRDEMLLPDAVTTNYSVFAMVQKIFADRLTLQAGLRYDVKNISADARPLDGDSTLQSSLDKDYGSFSGSAGGTWRITPTLLLRGNFAMAYRTPNLAELTSDGMHETRYELGNPALVSQKAYESDLSFHFHTENITADLAGFYNIIHDYIFIMPTGDTVPTGEEIFAYSQTNARLYGGEAAIHFHPKHVEWLHVEADYAIVRGLQKDDINLPFMPADHLKFEIMSEMEQFSLFRNAFVKISSETAFPQNRPAPGETSTSGYTLIDLGLGLLIPAGNQMISLGFTVNNLFDTKYIDHLSTLKEVGLYNPGRNFTLALKIPFGIVNTE